MSTTITLESLGFSREDLQERVIDRLCDQLLSGKSYDEDGNEHYDDSQFKRKLEERLRKHLDQRIDAIAQQHVLPKVTEYIETLCLQETNKWGEAKGAKVTFVEYLVGRAEAYIREEVNYEGKAKEENCYGSWSKSTTRIAYLVNRHLQYSIEAMTKTALSNANNAILGGIQQAVKIKLEEVLGSLRLNVTTK